MLLWNCDCMVFWNNTSWSISWLMPYSVSLSYTIWDCMGASNYLNNHIILGTSLLRLTVISSNRCYNCLIFSMFFCTDLTNSWVLNLMVRISSRDIQARSSDLRAFSRSIFNIPSWFDMSSSFIVWWCCTLLEFILLLEGGELLLLLGRTQFHHLNLSGLLFTFLRGREDLELHLLELLSQLIILLFDLLGQWTIRSLH